MATVSISVMLSLLASDRWDVYRSSAILPLVFRGRATAEPKRAAQFSARTRNRSGGGERLDQSRVDAPLWPTSIGGHLPGGHICEPASDPVRRRYSRWPTSHLWVLQQYRRG